MSDKIEVMKANPYEHDNLGSFGRAEYMLLRQFKFPNVYSRDVDQMITADHDRCYTWDYNHARRAFQKHVGGDMSLGSWVRTAPHKNVMDFLKDILLADSGVKWTGYRVMGTVNRSNGYPVWSLQLFAKVDKDTEVYSGENAPNVNVIDKVANPERMGW